MTMLVSPYRFAGALILSGVPAEADQSVSYSWTPSVAGAVGSVTYSLFSGTLPAGLSLNTSTGAVTGTPTTVENKAVTIRGTDSAGSSDLAVTFHVWGVFGVTVHDSTYAASSNEMNVSAVTTPGSAIYVDSVRAYVQGAGGVANNYPIIYADSSGSPGALVAKGPAIDCFGVGVTKTLPLDSSLTALSASTTYWVGAYSELGGLNWGRDTSKPAGRYRSPGTTWASGPPNPFGTPSTFATYPTFALHYRLQ